MNKEIMLDLIHSRGLEAKTGNDLHYQIMMDGKVIIDAWVSYKKFTWRVRSGSGCASKHTVPGGKKQESFERALDQFITGWKPKQKHGRPRVKKSRRHSDLSKPRRTVGKDFDPVEAAKPDCPF